jgi:hypothetical protein
VLLQGAALTRGCEVGVELHRRTGSLAQAQLGDAIGTDVHKTIVFDLDGIQALTGGESKTVEPVLQTQLEALVDGRAK